MLLLDLSLDKAISEKLFGKEAFLLPKIPKSFLKANQANEDLKLILIYK